MFRFKLKMHHKTMLGVVLTLVAAHVISIGIAEATDNDIWKATERSLMKFVETLEESIDYEKRPCDDFYGYVCETTAAKMVINNDLNTERELFEKFIQDDDQLMDSELKAKQFYLSCHTARSMDDLKSSHLYRMSGGWPAIEDTAGAGYKRCNATWMEIVTAFHDVGTEFFFQHHVEIKSNKRVVELLPDTKKRYTLRKYEQLSEKLLADYQVDVGKARLIGLEVVNFEQSRREIIKGISSADTNVEISYEEFKRVAFPQHNIDWDSYFRKVLGKPLKETDMIRVHNAEQLQNIFKLLENTSVNRLLNYIWIEYLMGMESADCLTLTKEYFTPVYQHIVERSALDKMHTAQMLSDIGRLYDKLLIPTTWIDEMTYENSKQFLGRVIHLTLNGDTKLDSEYDGLTISKRNFYRNLEKCKRFMSNRNRRQRAAALLQSGTSGVASAASQFMKIFVNVLPLLKGINMTTPLNYALFGEKFAEHMIAGGNTLIPGSWRSTDSDREYLTFKYCLQQQGSTNFNMDNLILKMLSHKQAFASYKEWQDKNPQVMRKIEGILAIREKSWTLNKIYFLASVLADCQKEAAIEKGDFVNTYLRNSIEFVETFSCKQGNRLYTKSQCNVF